jgi:predicted naringenin-chalcone synthase
MFISGLGTATPARRYSQRECWDLARGSEPIRSLPPRSQALLRKVLLSENGIEARHLALQSLDEVFETGPDALHKRFATHAPALAAAAAEKALADGGVSASEVDALLISTCTGYLCPGLTSYVSERLALRPESLLLDLVGQGCGAALPNLRTGEALLASGAAKRVLSVCVEVCSAAFYLDEDPGVLISACLFGDGAGAALLTASPPAERRRVEWKAAGTLLSAADRDYLRFEQKQGMLRNILGKQVPELAGKYADRVLGDTLREQAIERSQIATWILHAGGRDILHALRDRLGLREDALRWSSGVLREYGNLSSPCVLFTLQAALAGEAPGGYWWMSSFGAGFSCHGALLWVE